MGIIGPFSDGGYELWCNECGSKLTCFDLSEIFHSKTKQRNFLYYERFHCKECRELVPMNTNRRMTPFEHKLFQKLLNEYKNR